MNKIMILGCCGAGKSTLSKKMSNILELELIHLDQHYFQENWIEPSPADWAKKVAKFTQKDSWIIDGNYSATIDIRLKEADTVIYLYYSSFTCLYRVIKRVLKYWRKVRPDMAVGCRERLDFEFLWYVAQFNRKIGRKLLNKLKKSENTKRILIFNNDTEVQQFIDNLK